MAKVDLLGRFGSGSTRTLEYVVLGVLSVLVAAAVASFGWPFAPAVLVVIIGIGLTILSLLSPRSGLFIAIFVSFFAFYVKRYFSDALSTGVLIEYFLFIALVGVLIKANTEKGGRWNFIKNVITYLLLIRLLYLGIQVFNPNMLSISGWGFAMRKTVGTFAAFVITLYVIRDSRYLKQFLALWLGLACFAGLYGCYQEWFGFFGFESYWVESDELRFGLYYIDGRFRKFSILSDPTAFGIMMAISSLFCILLCFGPIGNKKRVLLLLMCIPMVLGLAYSGTRTAYAMIPAGAALFILMTINNKKTLLLIVFFFISGSIILYAPIYGNQNLNRVRSTFNLERDASLNVRDVNRNYIQPYILSHPIGGGIMTSGVLGLRYNPGHVLAGFPSDSAYVKSAIETGWIGLIIRLLSLFIVLKYGVHYYYRVRDPKIKTLYSAIVAVLFSLAIAEYTQSATGQIPVSLIFYSMIGILVRLKDFDSAGSSKASMSKILPEK